MRTVPVNQSEGPLPDGREPFRMMSMVELLSGLNARAMFSNRIDPRRASERP
jgi:hypothetical protein